MVRVTALMDDHASEHKALTAEHGLSYLVEMPELRLLFDCGASAVPMANAHRLGAEPEGAGCRGSESQSLRPRRRIPGSH